jgi:predicted small metal-binding protein
VAKVLRCECGYEARADDEDGLVAEVRRHAWQAHSMTLSHSDALQLTRRTEAPLRIKDESPRISDESPASTPDQAT